MAKGGRDHGRAGGAGWRAGAVFAAVAGVVAGLALAGQRGAKGPPGPPCRGNPDATTITEQTYTGSNGPDIIQADDQGNVIYGRGGADTICSYLGKDHVFGGKGKDVLWGENQNDKLSGGRGADVLRGGAGANDRCKGGPPSATGGGPGPRHRDQLRARSGASVP